MSAPFTSQEYQALLQELESLADPQYKAFHEGLIPGVSMAWGVRLPALRALAKKLLRGNPVGLLENSRPGSYEETLLRGLVIGGLNLPWEEKRSWVEDFLPRIDNWAVCDTFCNSLKPRSSEDRRGMWAFFSPFYASSQEYSARAACVVQISHFVDQEHVEEGLALLQQVAHPGYYAKMAVAWALSVWYVKFPQAVEELLAQQTLDPWVQNKSIQKVRESRRVGRAEKDALLAYRL